MSPRTLLMRDGSVRAAIAPPDDRSAADEPPDTLAARRWLRERLPHSLTDDLLRRLDRFESLLGHAVAPAAPVLPDTPQALLPWLPAEHQLQGLAWCRRFLDAAAHADPALRALLQACLLRAWQPFWALVTVPLETLFTADEIALLQAPREARPVEPARLRLAAGQRSHYEGYLCVILKLTRLCNLRCVYCHDWSADPQSHAALPLVLRAVEQVLQLGKGVVDFVLHGGEPLMLGRRGLLRLLALQAHLALPGQRVHNHLQTNGTLIDDEWMALLQTFGIRASVSIDGPQALHDRSRPDALGRGSHARAMAGLRRLREHDLLSGVLMVVTPEVLEHGAAWLHERLCEDGLLDVGLIPQRPAPGETDGIDHQRFVGFLVDFARCARQAQAAGRPVVAVRELEAVRRLAEGRPSDFCELGGNCVGSFIAIEADGRVTHCDKYTGDADYTFGNLHADSLARLLSGPQAQAIARRAAASAPVPGACRHQALCQGGCPHERYVRGDDGARSCCGLAPLFDVYATMP